MTNDEKQFVESIVNHVAHVHKAQEYIRDNFATNSEYDDECNILYIWSEHINENYNIVAAKEYLLEEIGSDKVDIVYGMKDGED